MFVGNEPRAHRRLSRTQALVASFLVIVVAVLLFYAGASVGAEPAWAQPALFGIASAFLGIGAVAVVYDLRLRQTVEDELLRLVGIERSLAKAGLVGAASARQVDWGAFLDKASEIRVLMADPSGWVSQNWNGLLAGGDKRAIHLTLLFPHPAAELLPLIARQLRSTEAEIQASVTKAAELVESSWKAAEREGKLVAGSRVNVSWIDEFPAYTLIKADDRFLAIIPPSIGRPPTDPGFAIGFSESASSEASSWLSSSFSSNTLRPVYEREVPA